MYSYIAQSPWRSGVAGTVDPEKIVGCEAKAVVMRAQPSMVWHESRDMHRIARSFLDPAPVNKPGRLIDHARKENSCSAEIFDLPLRRELAKCRAPRQVAGYHTAPLRIYRLGWSPT